MNMRYLIILNIVVLFLVMNLNAQNKQRVSSIQTKSDAAVIKRLSSKDSKKAISAAKEIFARGERMIPLLLELKGNGKCFYGLEGIGNWNRPGFTMRQPWCHATYSRRVTIETAALFLISAIFNEDLQFTEPPLLCDFSIEEKLCLENGNTPERIEKVWQATQRWYTLMKTKGLDNMREESHDPLRDSGISFY